MCIMNSGKKIYPTIKELSKINSNVHCTETGCTSIFTSNSNLMLHLLKTHKKMVPKSYDTDCMFHCPESTCIYNNERHFKTFKLLKQHFLKVHMEKTFICDNCNKGFPTSSTKNSHAEFCGVDFKCCNCDKSYPAYESLVTHARRKDHVIMKKQSYKNNSKVDNSKTNIIAILGIGDNKEVEAHKLEQFILPKGSVCVQVINMIPMLQQESTNDKGSQTELCGAVPKLKTKITQVEHDSERRAHISKHTQTGQKQENACAQTQTTSELDKYWNLKSIMTQTKPVNSKSQSCNTSFDLDDSEFGLNIIVERNTSSTQTGASVPMELLYSTSTATHDSIHTDTSDLNFEFINSSSQTTFSDDMALFDSSNYFNCNNETQTDFMLDNDILDYSSCYSDIHTQTCGLVDDAIIDDSIIEPYAKDSDIDLLVSTSQTQTTYDDISRSVESQTTISHSKLFYFLNCRDMAHMETQTEIDFKNILEEINA